MSITAAGLAGAAAISALIGGGLSASNSAISNAKQFNYQKKLIMYQAQLQKYMAQHAHQWEVGDLRQAGLNPILSANNGATANVSGGTASSNSAMDLSMGNTIADALNTWQANKNSAQSIENQKPVQQAQENLLKEQAVSEQNKRDNLDSQTKMNNLSAIGKEIENTYLPDTLKSQIYKNINSAKAEVAQVGVAQTMADIASKKLPSEIDKTVSEARYNDEKSRGYGNPISIIHDFFTKPVGSAKQFVKNHTYSHIQYENINGHRVPVKVYKKR